MTAEDQPMTGAEFKEGRRALGLSTNQCAELFKVSDGRTIRRWEKGERDIPGPAQVLMRALLAEKLPEVEPGRGPGRPPRQED